MSYKLMERILLAKIIGRSNVTNWTSRFITRLQLYQPRISLKTTHWGGIIVTTQDWGSFLRLIWGLQHGLKDSLLLKASKIIPCNAMIKFFWEVLTNHRFHVFLSDQVSRPHTLNNDLPQGSVLPPILFNMYTSNLPRSSHKFVCAEDITLTKTKPH